MENIYIMFVCCCKCIISCSFSLKFFWFLTSRHCLSPDSDIVMEEAPPTPTTTSKPPTFTSLTPAPLTAPNNAAAVPLPPPPHQPERDSWRSVGGGCAPGRLGLTKEVLSAHTQQEEQAFLDRFNDLSKLRVLDQTPSVNTSGHAPAALSRGKMETLGTQCP